MNLTNAQQVFIAQINEANRINGNDPISEQEILELVDSIELHYFFKAMEAYGKQKWEEACKEMWNAVNGQKGDLWLEDAMKIVGMKYPEFKP